MDIPNEREQEKKKNRIILYWRTYDEEKTPASTVEADSTAQEMFQALCSEVDSAKNFHPDERKSLEALGRFVAKYRTQVRFDSKT